MGKVQCTSAKYELSNDLIFNKSSFNLKSQSKFDSRVSQEYLDLKNKCESKRYKSIDPSNIDHSFVLLNHKKKFSRFLKWFKIAYEENSYSNSNSNSPNTNTNTNTNKVSSEKKPIIQDNYNSNNNIGNTNQVNRTNNKAVTTIFTSR